MTGQQTLAIYCGPFDGGSTAKIAARIANGWAARGFDTDLLVSASRRSVPEPLGSGVRVVPMGRMAGLSALPRMALYLRRHRPAAVLTHRIRENLFALKAARLAVPGTPTFVTVHGPMSVKLDNISRARSARRRAQVLHWYHENQGIVAISEETATDLHGLLGMDAPISIIPNPVVTGEMLRAAEAPTDHPWLQAIGPPVLVFAGRLEAEKDVPTLLQAFALLRQTRDCRLLILGDGELRQAITALRGALGLDGAVNMPGWAANPYPYLARASLVVLSSFWDALPTVLIEALALGTPVVSTDCGAGPREILADGRYGRLVPPRDPAALAEAMARTLEGPPPPEVLRLGAQRYEAQRNADLYLELMLGQAPDGSKRGG